ncbi:hypothetical protein COTS27_00725 [Spirochaetota bacterium]|nr:hypothetical protein COTS27_00725 [Spirochaetota bacterium]
MTNANPIRNTLDSEKVSPREYFIVFLKGMMMGVADIIPGISGGTIAFITGIYQSLITSLANILSIDRIKELAHFQFKEIYRNINASFLISLALGIGLSILTLAHTIEYLLTTYPVLIWSFFFALILSSALLIIKKNFVYTPFTVISFIIGFTTALVITVILTPATTQLSLPFIFGSGMIAITAMLLPGVSGSYLLVIMGSYEFILSAIKTLNLPILLTFMLGCGLGILIFSKAIAYILSRFYNITLALLSGFILGALPKAWPWKDADAKLLLPHEYSALYGTASLPLSIVLMLTAFFIIVSLAKFSTAHSNKNAIPPQ